MARVNSQGEIEKDLWNPFIKTIPESEVRESGKQAGKTGLSKLFNPWPRGTYAHVVWNDEWDKARNGRIRIDLNGQVRS